MRQKVLSVLCALCLLLVFSAEQAVALPWDMDMALQQSYKTREIARAPAEGTVPLGYQPVSNDNQELSTTLKNPNRVTLDSVWRGRRMYNANCATCHGDTGAGEGPVGPLFNIPNILESPYKDRSDGWIFGVIYNGQGNMPRYGYKFSHSEHWDIVNYLRFLQGKQVPGIELNK